MPPPPDSAAEVLVVAAVTEGDAEPGALLGGTGVPLAVSVPPADDILARKLSGR